MVLFVKPKELVALAKIEVTLPRGLPSPWWGSKRSISLSSNGTLEMLRMVRLSGMVEVTA